MIPTMHEKANSDSYYKGVNPEGQELEDLLKAESYGVTVKNKSSNYLVIKEW